MWRLSVVSKVVDLYNYHDPNHVLWLMYLIETVEIGVTKLVTIFPSCV